MLHAHTVRMRTRYALTHAQCAQHTCEQHMHAHIYIYIYNYYIIIIYIYMYTYRTFSSRDLLRIFP